MTKHRTFGTWLVAYEGYDPIGDLRDDFKDECRRKKILPSSIKTGSDMHSHMCRSAFEFGITLCEEVEQALEDACVLYGDPWRKSEEY